MRNKYLLAAVMAASFFLTSPSKAETILLGFGSGALTTDAKLLSLQITSHTGLLSQQLDPLGFRAHIEWSVFGLRGQGSNSNDVAVIGVSPVLRYAVTADSPFIEAGLGAYHFSKHMLNQNDGVGTSFEFGSFGGFGAIVGANRNVEIGYRFLHFSNAGMSSFNPGVNFHQVRLGYRF